MKTGMIKGTTKLKQGQGTAAEKGCPNVLGTRPFSQDHHLGIKSTS